MKPIAALLLSILAIPAAIGAEYTAKDFFARLAGDWQGAGAVRGMASAQKMSWEPVLDGKFLRLSFDNHMTGDDGKAWRFSAQAFYRIQDDGAITGTWFDSRGVSFPVSGDIGEDETLTILWGTDHTDRGRTSYRLTTAGLEVTDEVLMLEVGWRTFGQARLTRAPRRQEVAPGRACCPTDADRSQAVCGRASPIGYAARISCDTVSRSTLNHCPQP